MQETDGNGLNVKAFGAKGDDRADDTAAIQKAIDAAGETQGSVWFPAGAYRTGMLQLRNHVALAGCATFSYRRSGGTVLKLADPKAPALLNLGGTIGVHVKGLSLDGGKLGEGVHGIWLDGSGHQEEETIVIEGTRIAHFTGDGAKLAPIWGFTVRHCLFFGNGGDGLNVLHWDGYVYENIMIWNGGWGYAGRSPHASVTMTSNRIEWNVKGGVWLQGGCHYNINSNYIDRSGGPAIWLEGTKGHANSRFMPGTHALTGNILYRSGKSAEPETRESCHLRLEHVSGVTCMGNTLCYGTDDNGGGQVSPSYGMVLEGLRNCVVMGNAMNNACTRELVRDFGGHEGLVLKDNPGSVFA